jgi:hypothetical protein
MFSSEVHTELDKNSQQRKPSYILTLSYTCVIFKKVEENSQFN